MCHKCPQCAQILPPGVLIKSNVLYARIRVDKNSTKIQPLQHNRQRIRDDAICDTTQYKSCALYQKMNNNQQIFFQHHSYQYVGMTISYVYAIILYFVMSYAKFLFCITVFKNHVQSIKHCIILKAHNNIMKNPTY